MEDKDLFLETRSMEDTLRSQGMTGLSQLENVEIQEGMIDWRHQIFLDHLNFLTI